MDIRKVLMEFFDVTEARRSIRKFQQTSIEPAKLTRILEAICRAPSAGNLQAYRVFVIRGATTRQQLARAVGNQSAVAAAPIVLVFCADPRRSAATWGSKGEQLLCIQDTTVACAYAQLAATALGLASVWLGAVIEAETIREVLGLTEDLWPIALLPLGYPAEQPPRTPRRRLEDVIQEL